MDKDPKSELWGEAPDVPNKEETGADIVGVVNREEDEAATDGVANSEDPLPAEAEETADDVCGVPDTPGAAELEINPAT